MLKLKQDTNNEFKKRLLFFEKLSDLITWTPGNDDINVSRVTLKQRPDWKRTNSVNEQNKRDLRINVIDDNFEEFHNYLKFGQYCIQYWQFVDSFVYFSHHRVGIPPTMWVNAAHRNGTRVLGNFITEGAPGSKDMELLLNGPDGQINKDGFSTFFADKFVQMAIYYKFDGWFINIESKLLGREKAARQLIQWMKYLTHEMHKNKCLFTNFFISIDRYDSITTSGEIKYQNILNDKNLPFFNVCDGLFTNYWYDKNGPTISARVAGQRNRDVYTGIDVYGRGTYGGGGFNTFLALEAIKNGKTSAGIFASAWTFFEVPGDTFANDRLFWVGSPPGVVQRRPGVADYVAPKCTPKSTSFYTNFSLGTGHQFFIEGKAFNDRTSRLVPFKSSVSYNGGTSLSINSSGLFILPFAKLPLYKLSVQIPLQTPLKLSVTYLPKQPNIKFSPYIKIGSNSINNSVQDQNFITSEGTSFPNSENIVQIELVSDSGVITSKSLILTNTIPRNNGWITSEFTLTRSIFSSGSSNTSSGNVKNDLVIQEFGISLYNLKNPISHNVTRQLLGYVGELSIIPQNLKPTINTEMVQNVMFERKFIDTPDLDGLNDEVIFLWGIVKWNVMTVPSAQNSSSSNSDNNVKLLDSSTKSDKQQVLEPVVTNLENTFAYYNVYVGLSPPSPNLSSSPDSNEITFLGISDSTQFSISGYGIMKSEVESGNGLAIWIQGVYEIDGSGVDKTNWGMAWVDLKS
ncbi:5754_t:CDS:2 [Scutellospora calospora]|uniref:5754_t:CDS:1 n=1 Tax=Scutellospora calospora TaxID=85575 RepID=A0ACA9KPP0_9GLOM|nr:5754_t:CDS:2 [Scutellospora calospora]